MSRCFPSSINYRNYFCTRSYYTRITRSKSGGAINKLRNVKQKATDAIVKASKKTNISNRSNKNKKLTLIKHPDVKTKSAKLNSKTNEQSQHPWCNNGSFILQHRNDPNKSLLKSAIKKDIDNFSITNCVGIDKILRNFSSKEARKIKKGIEEEAKSLVYLNENHNSAYKLILDSTCKTVYTKERGWSVYATNGFAQFSVVGFYHGTYYFNNKELNEDRKKFGDPNVCTFLFGTSVDEGNIGGYKYGNVLTLVNSADLEQIDKKITNNLTVLVLEKRMIFFVAIRDIRPKEQLFVPYGEEFYSTKAEKS